MLPLTCDSCKVPKGIFQLKNGLCKFCRELNVEPAREQMESTQNLAVLKLSLNLISGSLIDIYEIKLYDSMLIQQALQLELKAREKMSGYSSGLGFVGNLGTVVINSMALGIFENMVSDVMNSDGQQILKQLKVLKDKIQNSGKYFPNDKIKNLNDPNPNNWVASDFSKFNPQSLTNYICLQVPFLDVNTNLGRCSIRWEHVERFNAG